LDVLRLTLVGDQVWQSLLAVRTLVLPPTDDVETWLKFASLCRKSGRDRQARATLVKLLQVGDPHSSLLSLCWLISLVKKAHIRLPGS
jgi:hypothetical protein